MSHACRDQEPVRIRFLQAVRLPQSTHGATRLSFARPTALQKTVVRSSPPERVARSPPAGSVPDTAAPRIGAARIDRDAAWPEVDSVGIDPRHLVVEPAQTTLRAPGNATDHGDFAARCEYRRVGKASLAGQEPAKGEVSFLRTPVRSQWLREDFKASPAGCRFSGNDQATPAHASAIRLRIGRRAGCEVTADWRRHGGTGAGENREDHDGQRTNREHDGGLQRGGRAWRILPRKWRGGLNRRTASRNAASRGVFGNASAGSVDWYRSATNSLTMCRMVPA